MKRGNVQYLVGTMGDCGEINLISAKTTMRDVENYIQALLKSGISVIDIVVYESFPLTFNVINEIKFT